MTYRHTHKKNIYHCKTNTFIIAPLRISKVRKILVGKKPKKENKGITIHGSCAYVQIASYPQG